MSQHPYQRLQHWILSPSPPSDAEGVVEPPQGGALGRVRIYWEAYRLRMREALKSDFPRVHAYLGDEVFSKACVAILTRHPPTHFNLNRYSLEFAVHLREQLSDSIALELLRFEQMILHALLAVEDQALNPTAVQSIGAEALLQRPLRLVHAAQLQRFDQLPSDALADVPTHWNGSGFGAYNPMALGGDALGDDAGSSVAVMIWRYQGQPTLKMLEAVEYELLMRLRSPHSLLELTDRLSASDVGCFQSWLTSWWLGECLTLAEPT